MTKRVQITAEQEQAMVTAHKLGRAWARNKTSRSETNNWAHSLTVHEGDAFLAGYYAELRRIAAHK